MARCRGPVVTIHFMRDEEAMPTRDSLGEQIVRGLTPDEQIRLREILLRRRAEADTATQPPQTLADLNRANESFWRKK